MPNDYLKQFENDAKEALLKFPDLKLVFQEGVRSLVGNLKITDKTGKEWAQFSIRVIPKECYPYCFPKVFEEGGKIPKIPDWHMYPDGSCCFDVLPGEVLKCYYGLNLTHFLQKIAVPFFADQAYRILEGHYVGREYSHGDQGLIEFFASKLNCASDREVVAHHLSRYLFLRDKPYKLKNFRNRPAGWSDLNKLGRSYLGDILSNFKLK